MTRGSLVTGVLLACLAAHSGSAQQPPAQTGTAVLAGVLTAVDDGQPVRKAQVELVSALPRMTRTTTSDGEGRWRFEQLPAADYTLSASRPGFLEMVYGARQPGPSNQGTPIRVTTGQRIENLSFELPRAGVIAGIITDEFGDPAFNVPVRAMRFAFVNGERIARVAGNATTDDLGAYRVAGLLPGDYLVTAVPRDTVAAVSRQAEGMRQIQAQMETAAREGSPGAQARVAAMAAARREGRMPAPPSTVGYVPVYYPGTATAAASARVQVGLSQQVFGINIRLEIVETATIAGTVLNVEGLPIQGNVKLIDPAMPVSTVGAWFGSSGPDGTFSFAGLVPGVYVLGANNSPPGTVGSGPTEGSQFQLAAPTSVSIAGGDVTNVELRMRPASTVSGTLELDTLTVPVDRSRLQVSLLPVSKAADWEMRAYRVIPPADSGAFVLEDVVAGRYRLAVAGLPDGWSLASAIFNNRDAADYHLEVEPSTRFEGGVLTLTNRTSELAGTVSNALGQMAPRQSVVVFPASRDLRLPQSRRILVTQSGPDGQYAFRNLPSGQYRVAVVPDMESGQEFDLDFLEELVARSAAVTLGEGAAQRQDLTVR